MFDAQKKDVLNAALKLDRYGLIALSGGETWIGGWIPERFLSRLQA